MKILITGSNGFIGKSLLEALKHLEVVRPLRTEWHSYLEGVDCVIHLAGKAHTPLNGRKNELNEYRSINVKKTLELAQKAALAKVKRFIFMSSIKVNGETTGRKKFTAYDTASPEDAYGLSKLEAELGLRQIASQTGMEVVIIRAPLVYGPGVKANFLSLLHFVNYYVPMPFGMIHNKRSFVSVDNLINLILECIKHPKAANKTFLVSDDQDISIGELLKKISIAFNKPAILIPVPLWILKAFFRSFWMKKMEDRLLASMQIDITYTKKILNWYPPYTIEQGLLNTVVSYKSQH
ncbi:NAD-dependent epimerase/dehydratase family protein [Candidatus Methylopumilus universalis]|uniref:NAD-dependent epimerase/dehydratase family protein n=1 Tax=Candidatus Methylopumilus universalis TaxID=2588536 RepID=UPI001122FBD9|nr:NAD-dependent epimerase/dehydratase family protein [Candidatus Methylopumilus universalis]QDC47502.1 NAD-dependent epimerase/dehydratase family protein [Candidatus Methylopumilus universalis]QDC72035.1 NAD-dependent epimerase/dehydratase family protein [Candidatus Methylopumilus universalis]